MAKSEKVKDLQDEPAVQDDVEPEAQPVAPVVLDVPAAPQTMPVENQQAVHAAAIFNPNAALQPGREEVSAHDGVVGEIEAVARKAESDGDHILSGVLNQLLVKLGEIHNHLIEAEKLLGDKVKPSISKISALFKN